jgi:hypothetical protein
MASISDFVSRGRLTLDGSDAPSAGGLRDQPLRP